MKFSIALSALYFATTALAVPNAHEKAPYGYASLNGGTTGGSGGIATTVSTLVALKAAVADDVSRIVWVDGNITGNEAVLVGSNKSILGLPGASLTGVGLRVLEKKNVIIRNLKISLVLADAGDAIGVQGTTVSNVWLDHLDLSNDRDHSKDYYDGLIDITHGVKFATVSYVYFHDHWKGSLVGHSDNNESEDTAMTVTFAYNHFKNIYSRLPSFRFGTGHIYNSFFESCHDGINTRVGAQLLVENNVFVAVDKPIFEDGGYAVARNNDLGGESNSAPNGSLTSVPYAYSTIANAALKDSIVGKAGATI